MEIHLPGVPPPPPCPRGSWRGWGQAELPPESLAPTHQQRAGEARVSLPGPGLDLSGLSELIIPYSVIISAAGLTGGDREGALSPGSWARHRWKTIIRLYGNSLSPRSVAETWTQWPETRLKSIIRRCRPVPLG